MNLSHKYDFFRNEIGEMLFHIFRGGGVETFLFKVKNSFQGLLSNKPFVTALEHLV